MDNYPLFSRAINLLNHRDRLPRLQHPPFIAPIFLRQFLREKIKIRFPDKLIQAHLHELQKMLVGERKIPLRILPVNRLRNGSDQ